LRLLGAESLAHLVALFEGDLGQLFFHGLIGGAHIPGELLASLCQFGAICFPQPVDAPAHFDHSFLVCLPVGFRLLFRFGQLPVIL